MCLKYNHVFMKHGMIACTHIFFFNKVYILMKTLQDSIMNVYTYLNEVYFHIYIIKFSRL